MAKTVFVPGSVVTSAFLNAVNNPAFVEIPDNDGEIALITDNSLSNVAGNIKPEWRSFRDTLQVTAGAGLSVNYTGGIVYLPNGSQFSIASGTLALTNNATSTIYISDTGAIVAGVTNLPVTRMDLARVTTVSGAISGAIIDLRPRFRILPRVDAIKVFGGSGAQGDRTITDNQTFTEAEYWFRNLTITSTGLLSIPAACKIYCSGNVLIQGNVVISPPVLGGGGTGNVSQATYHISGTGQGAGRGVSGGGSYNYSLAPVGSGGASAWSGGTTGYNVIHGTGGDGGGSIVIEAGGSITVEGTGSIICRGGNAGAGTIVNSTGLSFLTGAGGGSGGLILLKSLQSVIVTGTLDVRGGNGSNAQFASGFVSSGGGGGGGGQIALLAPTINTTGSTLLLTGGSAGSNLGSGGSAGGGGGGGFGGTGGITAMPGSAGQVILRTFQPVV